MQNNSFTEDDRKKVIEFLNIVATHARWDMDTQEVISFYKSLSYMQQVLLPKINASVLEVVEVTEPEENEE